jgi:hypothetical protein
MEAPIRDQRFKPDTWGVHSDRMPHGHGIFSACLFAVFLRHDRRDF